ncbi:hypothetical protein [Ligilactobacillus pobuzihii]|uniref:hypothetical protein n=1 Tax=Ligilactobacillus pobuzihii TaxID=449659 RepID=UPI00037B403F|nr:hypothetical protein [Ligilactobacillus pobuzihii]GEN48639.1 hypothetical protein LPO01_14310 [Ligilactobacillus pobuzihii]
MFGFDKVNRKKSDKQVGYIATICILDQGEVAGDTFKINVVDEPELYSNVQVEVSDSKAYAGRTRGNRKYLGIELTGKLLKIK